MPRLSAGQAAPCHLIHPATNASEAEPSRTWAIYCSLDGKGRLGQESCGKVIFSIHQATTIRRVCHSSLISLISSEIYQQCAMVGYTSGTAAKSGSVEKDLAKSRLLPNQAGLVAGRPCARLLAYDTLAWIQTS